MNYKLPGTVQLCKEAGDKTQAEKTNLSLVLLTWPVSRQQEHHSKLPMDSNFYIISEVI